MTLDVEIPDPPSLRGPQYRGHYEAVDMTDQVPEDDYRRGALETFLEEGAWQDAFEAWADDADITAAEFRRLEADDVFEEFDFYWNPETDDVGYKAPTVPDDARGAFDRPDDVEGELDTLGRVVTEVLENDYLLRDDETFGFFADDVEEDRDSE